MSVKYITTRAKTLLSSAEETSFIKTFLTENPQELLIVFVLVVRYGVETTITYLKELDYKQIATYAMIDIRNMQIPRILIASWSVDTTETFLRHYTLPSGIKNVKAYSLRFDYVSEKDNKYWLIRAVENIQGVDIILKIGRAHV